MNRILLAMSGGLDSSFSALLLQEQGYEVVGITLQLFDYAGKGCYEKNTGCCNAEAIQETKIFCEKNSIKHYIIDKRQEFNDTIIKNFINEYLSGRTPNPCVLCNTLFKWNVLLEKANELNCQFIATGHYANVRHENGRYILSKGIDDEKDQSYYLWQLTQEQLSRTIFPLGGYTKKQVRSLAIKKGLENIANKRESQEICFIPDDKYRKFLLNKMPELNNKVANGTIYSSNGKYLGTHKGYPFYTIGQRKGLGVAVGHPLYVTKIIPEKNIIILGEKNELATKLVTAEKINLIKYSSLINSMQLNTKIRYRSKAEIGIVTQKDTKIYIDFKNPVYAVTPGQSAVFYENNDVVGGGIIVLD